jgi:hypothetical protein
MRLSPTALIFACTAVLLTPVAASAAVVTIDGTPVADVIVREGHVLVPFRAPMEQIGATVDWSDATQTGTASISGREVVRAIIGRPTAYIEGYPKELTVAPVLIEPQHLEYVPVEVLPQISHAKMDLSPDGNTVTITNFDLAGVNDVGSGIASLDPHGKILYLWVWLLPISAVVAGAGYLIAKAPIERSGGPPRSGFRPRT